ncbi:hypothetical protein [Streptomyces scabiei]|uniref:hypothetical protein n=1 Tax=Streptomyces scabiei TaxID=1930 RepID=UPI0027E05BE6|nr:hypothetical protein [Streptomyces sp. LBUM 1481]
MLWVGGRHRVPTAYLLRTLGIEERPLYAIPMEDDMPRAAWPYDNNAHASEDPE